MVTEKDQTIQNLKGDIETKLQVITLSSDQEKDNIKSTLETSIKLLKETHENEISSIKQAHSEEIQSLKSIFAVTSKRLEAKNLENFSTLQNQNSEQLREVENKHNKEILESKNKIHNLSGKVQTQNSQIKELQKLLDTSLVQLQKKSYVNDELKNLINCSPTQGGAKETEMGHTNLTSKSEIDRLKGKIRKLKDENFELQGKVSKKQDLIQELSKELTTLKTDLDGKVTL